MFHYKCFHCQCLIKNAEERSTTTTILPKKENQTIAAALQYASGRPQTPDFPSFWKMMPTMMKEMQDLVDGRASLLIFKRRNQRSGHSKLSVSGISVCDALDILPSLRVAKLKWLQ
jgi:hypothetical protein